MELLYKSTRSADKTVTASYAILKGLAEDGGLFVPTSFPKLDISIDRLADMSYQEVAYEVMKLFLTDFTEEELKHCINSAYDQKFDTEVIAPLVKADDAYYRFQRYGIIHSSLSDDNCCTQEQCQERNCYSDSNIR